MKRLFAALVLSAALAPAAKAAGQVCAAASDGSQACVSQEEFSRLLREELNKLGAEVPASYGPAAPPPARAVHRHYAPKGPAPLLSESWHYPLEHKWPLSSLFGWRMISRYGEPLHKDFHPGLDIAAYAYTPVFPARPGRVLYAGYVKGFGNCVVMEHANRYRSIYGHLSEILVRSGQRVRRRIPLGLSGNTGDSLGAHLHFEIRTPANKPVNPAPLLGVPAVRTVLRR